ncbi:MAG: TetR/AcrR family transcriptional regulator [Bacteroidetes bacterium]|nr:TetR/AcrR family transcriptional regulator [Bacteroidota bacterium]
MPTTKKRNTKVIADASKEKIFQTAFDLFALNGYSRTSVDAIAKKAKISKGLIYHYFTSKEDILRGIFLRFVENTSLQMTGDGSLPPKAALKQMIDFSISFIIHEVKLSRLMIALVIQPDVIKGINKDMSKLREGWWGVLIDLLKKMGYKNPEAEGYFLGAILDGISLGYIAMGKSYPIEKVKRLIKKKYEL